MIECQTACESVVGAADRRQMQGRTDEKSGTGQREAGDCICTSVIAVGHSQQPVAAGGDAC